MTLAVGGSVAACGFDPTPTPYSTANVTPIAQVAKPLKLRRSQCHT